MLSVPLFKYISCYHELRWVSFSSLSHLRLSKFQTSLPLFQTHTFSRSLSKLSKILAEEELYDLLYEDDLQEQNKGIQPRYNMDDPIKGIGQLCSSVAKWVDGELFSVKIFNPFAFIHFYFTILIHYNWNFYVKNILAYLPNCRSKHRSEYNNVARVR